MADDEHAPEDGPTEDAESSERTPRGLGRFASRFRRDRSKPEPEPTPKAPELDVPLIPRSREVEPEDVQPSFLRPGAPPSERRSIGEDPPEDTVPDAERAPEPLLNVRVEDSGEPEPPPESRPEPRPEPRPESQPESQPRPERDEERDLAESILAAPALEAPDPVVEPVEEDPPPALAPALDASWRSTVESPGAEDEPEDVPASTVVPRYRLAGLSPYLVVVTGLATLVILAFLLIEPSPRWLLLLGAAAVVFGLDGTLRQTWREPFSLGQETASFLFVPALYVMAVPVLIEHNVSGELVLLAGLGAGLGFGALAWAEIASVRPMAPEYDQARLLVTANTYLTGFAIFSLSYVFDIGLPAAIIATAIAASMLAVEVLREGEVDPMETLGLSLVTGVVIGEIRWLLYYVPLDTYLAGLTLLLAFYLATGLLHSHVIRTLNRVIAFEYSGIAAAGIALVVIARAAGLA